MNKILLQNLGEQLKNKNYALLLGLGFDQRCLETLKHLSSYNPSTIVGIVNAGWNNFSIPNIESFCQLTASKGVVLGSGAKNAIGVADEVALFLREKLQDPTLSIVIDVTALSHELLGILLGIVYKLDIMQRVTLLYVGASEYSFNSSDDSVWLSRGVANIRSILGFPGIMSPSKKLHLIILAGFEVERAAEVISCYEPAALSIGLGRKEHSISEDHHNKNKLFFDHLEKFSKEQDTYNEEIKHFDFSCIDPLQTKADILSHIDKYGNEKNIVICPLNTKLSTVGVILAALDRPEIQICYAQPLEYNVEGYARAGSEVTIIDL